MAAQTVNVAAVVGYRLEGKYIAAYLLPPEGEAGEELLLGVVIATLYERHPQVAEAFANLVDSILVNVAASVGGEVESIERTPVPNDYAKWRQ